MMNLPEYLAAGLRTQGIDEGVPGLTRFSRKMPVSSGFYSPKRVSHRGVMDINCGAVFLTFATRYAVRTDKALDSTEG
jgi:hypothetical protein